MTSVPPSLALTCKVGNPGHGDAAVGLAINSPYGAGFAWPNEWAGRASVQELKLQTVEISPVIAWRPNQKVGFGFGCILAVEFASRKGKVEAHGRVAVRSRGRHSGLAAA